MKLITLNKITDGMVLAKNIFTRKGNVLLVKDACLKSSYIKRLSEWGVNSVYVIDKQGDTVEIDQELYLQAKEDLFHLVEDFANELSEEQLPSSMRRTIEEVMAKILSDDQVLKSLVEIRAMNINAFRHLGMDCIFSILIGNSAGYDFEHLTKMVTGVISVSTGQRDLAKKLLSHLPTPREITKLNHHSESHERLHQFHHDYENAVRVVLERYENSDNHNFLQEAAGSKVYQQISSFIDPVQNEDLPNMGIPEGELDRTRLFSKEIVFSSVKNSGEYFEISTAPDGRHASSVFRHLFGVLGNFNVGLKEFNRLFEPSLESQAATLEKLHSGDNQLQYTPEKVNSLKHQEIGHPSNNHRHDSLFQNSSNIGDSSFLVTPEQFSVTQSEALMVAKREIAKLDPELIPPQVIETTRTTLGELLASEELVNDLVTIQALDGSAFYHCLSVNSLSVMAAAFMGYSPSRLKESEIAKLGVDSGKMQIARKYNGVESLLGNNPADPWIVQADHLSFDRLWELKTNPQGARRTSEFVPAQSESGELVKEQNLVEIVALADTYLTLMNQGINGQRLMPHEVIEYIRDCYGTHINPEVKKAFLQCITPFLIGSYVLLNNGEKAKVLRVNPNFLTRPMIEVLYDQNGQKLSTPIQKDLKTDLTLFITSALKDKFDQ